MDQHPEPSESETPAQMEPTLDEIEPIQEVEKFMQIQRDRLLKIYIGQDTTQPPFLIQESTLINSSDYFLNIIRNNREGICLDSGVLYLPEDGDKALAWAMMLYWMVNKRLPSGITESQDFALRGKHLLLFTQAWVLADKYLMSKLQNTIMMALINHFEDYALPFDAALVNKLLSTSPVDTPLRRILSEETVHIMYAEEPNGAFPGRRMKSSELVASDGARG
ncbi:hypothetical protein M409DRAFT_25039 [Zasmidium cellare ATCC 36951]|uniref:BTB domain-containing protein n=1 Tax=Zasmidium cellare ATCC 36951 TaxID=1080233 RepID=A0A6A6CC71_ZASCE|nr:uncharacterized protein M409DRAFT_25039 [Zasmidium cellare ATCC 36951]KAF2164645.1 hypothetical protein M409DRAFT_25039 [Zasmidium cellare ATCC 36951]